MMEEAAANIRQEHEAAARGRRRVRAGSLAVFRLLVFAGILGFWEYFGRNVIGIQWVSSPTLVGQRLLENLADGSLVKNTVATLSETIIGLVLGVLVGIVGGILVARAPKVIASSLDPYILGLYSLPRVALAPFFILWFGIGLESKVALVVSVVAFVVLFNVRQGIEGLDRDLVDVLRSMHASRWEMTRYVTIPAIIPWIVSAVKISVGLALVSAVIGEMVGSTEGLGWFVVQSLNQFDMTGGMTSLLIMAVAALVLYAIVTEIEHRVIRWQTIASTAKTVRF